MATYKEFIFERIRPAEERMWDAAMEELKNRLKRGNGKYSISSLAYDVLQEYPLGVKPNEFVDMFREVYPTIQKEETTTTAVPGAGDDSSTVVVRKGKTFDVPHHIFRRFQESGPKIKYERWKKHLNEGDVYENRIMEYIKNNRKCSVTLRSHESREEFTITP